MPAITSLVHPWEAAVKPDFVDFDFVEMNSVSTFDYDTGPKKPA